MERTDIKPADDGDFMGTNLNEDSWVPFNDNEPDTETRLPPRPEPTVGIVPQDQQQQQQEEMMRQQQEEMMRQQQYMNMMQPPLRQDAGIMTSIKETPITTIAVIFAIGLALGFVFNNRRPIILNGSH